MNRFIIATMFALTFLVPGCKHYRKPQDPDRIPVPAVPFPIPQRPIPVPQKMPPHGHLETSVDTPPLHPEQFRVAAKLSFDF